MKSLRLTIIAIIFFAISGCNYYESEVPISNSEQSSIDTTLLGKWILSTEKHKEHIGGYLKIISFNDHEYLVELIDYKDSTELIRSVENLRVYNSTIGDNEYFNAQLLEKDGRSNFLIFRYQPISRDRLKLFYLSKDCFQQKFEVSESFEDFIKENQKDFESCFQLEGILIRKND